MGEEWKNVTGKGEQNVKGAQNFQQRGVGLPAFT